MGFFGKKEQVPDDPMLVVTTESIPGRYVIVDLVLTQDLQQNFNVYETKQDLIKQARQLGADAIIGFRVSFSKENVMVYIAAYGTAVKFIE